MQENEKQKSHCLANIWWFQNGSRNFGLKSYLWFQFELALRARSILKSLVWFQTKLHSTQFNCHYKSLETLVNCELRKVCNWPTASRLTLNIDKSNYVFFRPYQKRLMIYLQTAALCGWYLCRRHNYKLLHPLYGGTEWFLGQPSDGYWWNLELVSRQQNDT